MLRSAATASERPTGVLNEPESFGTADLWQLLRHHEEALSQPQNNIKPRLARPSQLLVRRLTQAIFPPYTSNQRILSPFASTIRPKDGIDDNGPSPAGASPIQRGAQP
ncbi:hypothetical protein VTH06DRAFT_4498 [Thermothelomyces fergusii]